MKKRILSVLITVVMLIGMLPTAVFAADSVSRMPGARVETNTSGDVFLGGNYIEMGISKRGSFGTYASPKTSGWHKQSDLSGIGFRSDEDGWDVGEEPVTGDFFLPGTPEERWILSYKLDGQTYEHLVADRNSGNIGSWREELKTVNASDLERGNLKAVVTGITSKNVKIEITYSFGVNDLFYTTDVKVTNLGDADIEDVRFVRSFDPDQDKYKNGTHYTYNKVICNPDSTKPASDTNYALVVARGEKSLAGFFFLSFDNRARVSRGVDFDPNSAYLPGLWDTAPVTEKTFATDAAIEITSENSNDYTREDSAIAITFNISTLSAAASTELQYYSSLDPDVMNSLKNVLAGNVDYTEEVLMGLYAGASYQITYDGVTYLFKNIPKSTIPLVGTAPTTADPTSAVVYDFLGKTITVVEVNESGDTVSEEQELTIASRPGEVKPGETLPEVPAPVIENITTTLNSITIDPAVEIQEYSLDGQNWIRPTDGKISFTGLEAGTGYTVYSRVAATSEYPASQICSLLVYTDAYMVTLDYGALGSEVTYAQASGKLDLDIPVFDGYIFMGWYTGEDFNTAFDFDNPITATTTVYAKFADYEDDKAELQAAIDALETAVDNVETALDNKVSTDKLTEEIGKLNDAIQAAKDYADTQDAALKTTLEAADATMNAAITELQNRVTALETGLTTANGKIDTNTSDIGTLKTDVSTLKTWKNNAQDAIDALQALTSTQGGDIDNLKDAVSDLISAMDSAEAKITAAENRIATLEGKVSALETAKQELKDAVSALQTAVAGKADTATVNAAIAELEAAIEALEAVKNNYIGADDDLRTELEGKIANAQTAAISAAETLVNNAKAELQSKIDAKADAATTTAAIQNLQAAVAALEAVKDDYATADATLKTELEGKIATAKSEAISAAEALVNNAKAELQSKIDAKADAATTTVAIQNLQAAVAALEAVKDDYATADATLKTELEGKIANAQNALQAAIEEIKQNLTDAKAELEQAIANGDADLNDKITNLTNALNAAKLALESADAALKSELEAAIATAKSDLEALIGGVQSDLDTTKAKLDKAIEDLNKAITDGDKDLSNEIAALNTALTNAKEDLEKADSDNKAELVSKIETADATLDAAIKAVQKNLDDAKAELDKAIADGDTALDDKISNLNAALESAKAALEATDAANKTELEGKIANAQTAAISAAETLVNNAKAELQSKIDAKADAATTTAAIQNLQAAVAALEAVKDDYATADATLKTELEGKIATAKSEAISAAEALVNNAKAELQSKIDAKADAATTTAAIQNLQAAVAALEAVKDDYATADATLKTELEGKIETAKSEAITAANTALTTAKNELSQAIALKADTATLNAKVDALNTAIANAESVAKAYADTQDAALKAELQTAIANAKSEAIGAAQLLVDNAKAELQTAIDTKADTATVNAAIANLQNAITALEAAKDNYASADAALKLELEAAIERAKQEAIEASKGYIPYIGTNGNWWIGDTDTGVDANGIKGDTGATGNGIASITTSKTNGITTVTIKFTDPNMADVIFTIEDGTDGAKGDKGDTGAQGKKGDKGNTGAAGADGVGIANIEKTSSDGNVDTYTITLTNGTTYTFTVTNGTNGTDGKDGKDGVDGKDGTNGTNGVDGKDGSDGKDGQTPYIGENGNWWIGDTDTGVKAAGDDGKDGAIIIATAVGGTALISNIALIAWTLIKKKKLF